MPFKLEFNVLLTKAIQTSLRLCDKASAVFVKPWIKYN